MMLNDLFHVYALKKDSDDIYLMLQDYKLDNRLDREALNTKILLDLGDRYPYYNETTVMKIAIENWFLTHAPNINRMLNALEAEYDIVNPIEFWEDGYNKDKPEYNQTEILTETGSFQTEHKKGTATTKTGSITDVGNTVEEQKISAYNATEYQPQAKTESSPSNTQTFDKVKDTQSGSDYDIYTPDGYGHNKVNTSEGYTKNEDTYFHHKGREDNTPQDLIKEEWQLAKLNVYDWIVNELGEKICLSVF